MKRVFSLLLAVAMSVTFCLGMVTATELRASSTLSQYTVDLAQGNSEGELDISYDIRSNGKASSLGVESADIYTSDGSYVTTITGTTRNGMISSNSSYCSDTYTYKNASSGVSYYVELTVFANVGNLSDSKTATTSTVAAP